MGDRDTVVEVTALGEAMAVLHPGPHQGFAVTVGGAEFNVVSSLARMGHDSGWISRVGADDLGRRVLDAATTAGLDTSAVEVDPAGQTGLYIKERSAGGGSVMRYYRTGSAASGLESAHLDGPAVRRQLAQAAVVHVSGITPALAPGVAAAALRLRELMRPEAILSVDLNFRPRLWPERRLDPLLRLIDAADLLFAGSDEAHDCFGDADPRGFFARHGRLKTVVIKAETDAGEYRRDGSGLQGTRVPRLRVDVAELIGAGDAFAAGYLAGLLEGRGARGRLRLGHALAAAAIVGHGDQPDSVPDADARELICAVSDAEWGRCRVTGGTRTPWAAFAAAAAFAPGRSAASAGRA